MKQVAENLWTLSYPLKLLGMEIGRNVTVIRLRRGDLVIHSTAPFTREDIAAIRRVGEPKWLVDVSRFHDSFARHGRAAFPDLAYLVPDGFPNATALRTAPLDRPPAAWEGELELREIEGMPKVQEHAMFHVPSRTLILADLFFHFGAHASWWTRIVVGRLMRLRKLAGMSPFFQFMIRDRAAVRRSLEHIMKWDFERVIVAHGEIIDANARGRIAELIHAAGLS